jgi:hypothetical protein
MVLLETIVWLAARPAKPDTICLLYDPTSTRLGSPPSSNASLMASFSIVSVSVRSPAAVSSVAAAVAAVESAPAAPREPLPLIHALNDRSTRAVVVLPATWPLLPSRIDSMSFLRARLFLLI